MIRVYIDTSIVRFADSERTLLVPKKEKFVWGNREHEMVIHLEETFYPLEKLNKEEHAQTYADAKLIPEIESIAREGLVKLCWHFETKWEYVRKRRYAAPPLVDLIEDANCPFYYGRMLTSPFKQVDEQYEFLRRLRHPGYEKWKKLVGAQPDTKKERNQLMDAWHLWSADHNHCEYFLTMDYRLIDSVASRKNESKLRIVTPSQFLKEFKVLYLPAVLERTAWGKINGDRVPKKQSWFARFRQFLKRCFRRHN